MARKLPNAAQKVLRARKRSPSEHWSEKWHDEHGRAFVVAQMAQADMLRAVHAALVVSLKSGTTKREFVKTLGERLGKMGWAPTGRGGDVPFRLKRIYDINRRVSRAAGQWERIQRTKRLLPYLLYGLGPSEKHRDAHVALAGKCLPADDEFWDTHFPPNGWGCKCWVRQVTRAERDRRVKKNPAAGKRPEIVWERKQIVDAGGEIRRTVKVPRGVDAGWAYNPGASPWEGVSRSVERTMMKELARAGGDKRVKNLIRETVGGLGFEEYMLHPPIRWIGKRQAEARTGFPVALLSKKQAAGGARLLGIKPAIAGKQLDTHGKRLRPADYLRIQDVIDAPEFSKREGGRTTCAKMQSDINRYAFLVYEREGNRNVLVSFFIRRALGEAFKKK